MNMLRFALITGAVMLQMILSPAAWSGDTIRIKTLTFDDITKRSGTWLFPPVQQYEKVLLEYTLKCDQRTTQDQYPCGEWDYLTYIIQTDSTGEWDSTALTQVNYVVHGTTPDAFPYTTNPTASKKRYTTTTVTRGSQGEMFLLGTADQANANILRANGGRAQYVVKASELLAAGLTAGPINGIELTTLDSGAVTLLTIRLYATDATTLTSPLQSADFTTVVKRNAVLDNSKNHLPFERVFTWDGQSNIIVELACLKADKNLRLSSGTSASQGILSDSTHWALAFNAGDRLELPQAVGEALNNEVTIAFWSFGNAQQLPTNHNAFEAYDASGRRVLNVHLPWSDGTVYWDAGRNDTQGPDRISKAANPQDYEGRWHHWAFVKNATSGTMTIYLDGELFIEGTGKTLPMNGITRFVFGSGESGSYPGMFDEIQIWKKALSAATIKTWMAKHLSPDHPDYTSIVAYYDCEASPLNSKLLDVSGNSNHAVMWGMPTRENLGQDLLGYQTLSSSSRPQLSFEVGSALGTNTRTDITIDQSPETTTVVLFGNNPEPRVYALDATNLPSLPTDTIQVYEAGWLPIYDEVGLKVDSFLVAPTTTLQKTIGTYFSPIAQFELGRYITPYGIGLDLGENGFKWVYDLTDFAPLLRNNVTLSAGNQQELIDMTFLLIKGKPAREVKQIDQVWYERNAMFPDVLTNKSLAPKTIELNPDAKTFRLKSVTSGHDFSNPTNCAEFCKRTHSYTVDGTLRFSWDVWKECGDNPVYPQGGTWLLDRTGWCPGAPVDLHEFELTPFTTNKQSVTIDYGIKADTSAENWGRWEVSGQLIGYSSPTSQVDAELADVLAPNNWEFYSRFNPVCGQPIVVLKNRGAKPLTSCTIAYKVGQGAEATYAWTGNLLFLEADTIALEPPQWSSSSDVQTFTVEVRTTDTDEYLDNNTFRTSFMNAPVLYSDLVIQLRTNKYASEQYQWELRKIGGSVLKSGANLADNQVYADTFQLEKGCYEYRLINKLGYGLDFWFLRNDLGSGSLLFKSGNRTIKTFEPDFGNSTWFQFSVDDKPTIGVNADTVYFNAPTPRPVEQSVWVTPVNDAPLLVDSINIVSVKNYFTIKSVSRSLPTTLQYGDSIQVTVVFDRSDVGASSATLRVYSNDERTPVKTIRCIGNNGATGVADLTEGSVSVCIVPQPANNNAVIQAEVYDQNIKITSIVVVNSLGEEVYHTTVSDALLRWPVPTWIPSGRYVVLVQTTAGVLTTPMVIAR